MTTLQTDAVKSADPGRERIIASVPVHPFFNRLFFKKYMESDNVKLFFLNTPLHQTKSLMDALDAIHKKTTIGTTLLAFSATSTSIKKNILAKSGYPLNHIAYFFHFSFHRVFPKISSLSARLYALITKNKICYAHFSEILGRITSSGFTISEFSVEEDILMVAAKKTGEKNTAKVSKGLFFTMPRIGKDGRTIYVYKLRTMHAYSEYLQELILQRNGLDSDGKFKDDFRIAGWGKVLRKYWFDEIPMLLNLIKGDIKLVGVRPLSKKYFALYPEEAQKLRIKTKPGLIPPSYAYSPTSLWEIIELEKSYLLKHQKDPFMTDIKYLGMILANLFRKKIRSK